jgi:arylsulfatase A-like enzyme
MVPGGAIRSGKWKLIENYEKSLAGHKDQAYELYDLDNDLSEVRNLAADQPKRVSELAKELHDWRKKVNAQMPVKR